MLGRWWTMFVWLVGLTAEVSNYCLGLSGLWGCPGFINVYQALI